MSCVVCTGRAELFLCVPCQSEMQANLTKLIQGPYVRARHGRVEGGGQWYVERRTPGLLDNLADVVLRRTRLGGGGGHRKRGDEIVVPFEPHTGKMVKDKKTGEDTDEPILSPQGRADHLLHAAHNHLSTIVRDLCESRGGQPKTDGASPVDMAIWLADHVHTIACDESAGQWWAEIDVLARTIERLVDRPVRYELLGFCNTELDQKACGAALRAPADAIEVRCPTCRTVRRCDIVRRIAQNEARRELITWQQVLDVNKRQPDDWRVNERTLRDWRSTGALKIREYRRPNGDHGYHKHSDDDQPLYKWDDVEHLRSHGVPRGGRKRTRAGR